MADGSKKTKIDKALIRDLAELLDETSLSEIEIEQSGLRVRVARTVSGVVQAAPAAAPAPSAPAPAAQSETAAGADVPKDAVTSPMVGTIYMAAAPGAAPFIKV